MTAAMMHWIDRRSSMIRDCGVTPRSRISTARFASSEAGGGSVAQVCGCVGYFKTEGQR